MPYNILAEFGSTALMIIFGVGVHCDTVLKGTKYQGSGHMFAITTWSFGISVCLFIFGGSICMNPAMALAQCILGLVPWSMFIAHYAGDNLLLCAICVGLLVWAVGMGMGGITGFAMNQARDLGPRMAYQVLPIKNKADNNWKYGLTVPGLAPFVGATVAALFVHGFLGIF
jgi:glycerol uptake facilitator-like aquaporin